MTRNISRIWTTIGMVVVLPATLTACGKGNIGDAKMMSLTKAQIAVVDKNAAENNIPSPFSYCRTVNTDGILLQPAAASSYGATAANTSSMAGQYLGEIIGPNPLGSIIGMANAGDYASLFNAFDKAMHSLAQQGLVKVVPFMIQAPSNQLDTQINELDAFLWVGPAANVTITSYQQYASLNGTFEIATLQRVSAMCGGELVPTTLDKPQQPAKTADGQTFTNTTAYFSYQNIPSWLTDASYTFLEPISSGDSSQAPSAENMTNDMLNYMAGGNAGSLFDTQSYAPNPKEQISGVVGFIRRQGNWEWQYFEIPDAVRSLTTQEMSAIGF